MNASKKFLIIFFSIIIGAVLLFSIFSLYVNGYNKALPNTFIDDINVGKMTEDEILTLLDGVYQDSSVKNGTITLLCKTNTLPLSTENLGVRYDNAATADIAASSGKEGNIIERTASYISRLFNSVVIEPSLSYDETLLSDSFDTVAKDFETEPVGHTFKIENDSVTIFAPVDGIKADREVAKKSVEKQIRSGNFGRVELVPAAVSPKELDYDEFYKWLTSDAKDAFYEKIDGKVVVHESKPKCIVEGSEVKSALLALQKDGTEEITISAVVTQPEHTFDEMTEILYKDVLGSYSTNFGSSSAARANNVRLAASRIDGIELMPGEEFSYDKAILPRTYANGYKEAGVYVGNKVESGMGGGICQPSSTLYAAALYANLEILERHNHSLPVSYLPAGLDATIAEGYLDLRLKNSTDYPIKISAKTQGGVITFKILGYNADNISVDIERSFINGAYHVTRVVKQDGVEIKREKMTSSVYGVPEKDEEEKPEEEKPEEEKPEEKKEGETAEGENNQEAQDGEPSLGSENQDNHKGEATADVPDISGEPTDASVPDTSVDSGDSTTPVVSE